MQPSDEPGSKSPAPDDLRTVQLFVNSLDIEAGAEEWTSPAALRSWLHGHGLTASRSRFDQEDLERARAFRELVRAMALANNGVQMSSRQRKALSGELARLRFVARLDPGGAVRFDGAGDSLDQALARIVAIVGDEVVRGRWSRMKACARDACNWVFYDHSRNRTGTWCSMAVCGTRTKVSAYYRRHRRRALR